MLKIGKLQLPSNVLVAPLAGVSDSAYRLICREFGASFTFIEMINARALSHKNKVTKKMLATDPKDRPIGVQLLGCETPYVERAIDVLEKYDFDLLDFNAACPVKKVCRRGEGAALMKEPEKLQEILKAIVSKWKKPVTIKIRSGWDENTKNAVTISRIAQDCGIQAIFVHGRDRKQFYKGAVDYKIIADVKKSVSIPVIASGDIFSAQHAKKMFDETGCDGILIARGGLGNPWIFKEVSTYFENGRIPEAPNTDEIINTLLHHLELSIAEHGEKKAVPIMRKFVGWYFKGRRFVRPLRQSINPVKTKKEFTDVIEALRGT
ncbi:MAG: tRNA dihydrouridine synthase DusB [Candidatus Omnitrophica bacterium]|nr:tRNA dihydrouridine synthase DusB [Candidatus Omnitrophota bacterium]